jgi:uncharacterized protein DUF4388
MSLRGSLDTMTLDDILDWLDRRSVCGLLTVERGAQVRTFQVDSGSLTGAGSSDPHEHLGRLLVSRKLCTEAQLAEALRVRGDTGVALGKVLIMVGAVAEAGLRQVLEEKIRESLGEVMSWNEGSFEVERTGASTVSELEISVNLRATLEEARARGEQWRTLRQVLPSDEAMLYVVDEGPLVRPGDPLPVAEEARRLAEYTRRDLSVAEMCLAEGGRRFATVKRLVDLIERGALALDRRTTARTGEALDPADVEKVARRRAAEGDRSGALELARLAVAREPDNPALQKLHRDLERSLFAELSRDLLASFRVPRLLVTRQEIEAMDLDDAERYLAGRVDGRWDLLSLLRGSQLRELDALITFKRLADRGIIAL